jgi:amidase
VLCYQSARELARLVRAGQLTVRDVMAAHLDRIARVNPILNAIVSKLDDEQCLALADEADRALRRGGAIGPLHGLPFAFKDLEPAVGFPATSGSPIFRDFHPSADSAVVARLRAAGVVAIGKTNVPEFGMGSHTYNRVFGTTRNPYDRTKTAGGSSGGAGAALAAGMLPLADGSDLGGSLRNPANFNNIVALRPTVGTVPADPPPPPLRELSVKGPMARSVDDVALLFEVMSGRPVGTLERAMSGARVAWSPDLGGLPVDREVRAVLERARDALDGIGCITSNGCPDLSEADDVFLTIRRRRAWLTYGHLLARHRGEMKPEAIEELEAGAAIDDAALGAAIAAHDRLRQRIGAFFERYDYLACAVNQVPPFDADLDWPRSIDGMAMEHYVAWMKSAYWISATCCPAVSVPAGFTRDGLPVGLQLVAPFGRDIDLLQIAYAFEQAIACGRVRPPD